MIGTQTEQFLDLYIRTKGKVSEGKLYLLTGRSCYFPRTIGRHGVVTHWVVWAAYLSATRERNYFLRTNWNKNISVEISERRKNHCYHSFLFCSGRMSLEREGTLTDILNEGGIEAF